MGLRCPKCGSRHSTAYKAHRDPNGRIIALEAICHTCKNAWRSKSMIAILNFPASQRPN